MSATKKPSVIENAYAFDAVRKGHGVVLSEYEVARVHSALQGVHAITALLQQREIDTEMEDGLSVSGNAVQGLLSALACCAELAGSIVDTGGLLGARAQHGEPAYAQIEVAAQRIRAANRKGGAQ